MYVGTDQHGLPLAGTGAGPAAGGGQRRQPGLRRHPADAFRFAINPPMREQINPPFPELVVELAGGLDLRCPSRPCPQAIDVQDPGMLAVNYRAEPIGLRIFDPNKLGPDGKPGMQADGQRGDLAFALQSRTDRAIAQMNVQPTAATVINGTRFPPPINAGGVANGDPFTPMLRAYAGDKMRVKIQAGGHEEEHNASIHGVKWLRPAPATARAPTPAGATPRRRASPSSSPSPRRWCRIKGQAGNRADYAWSVDGGDDGWWSGMWGLMRAYNNAQNGQGNFLFQLPTTAVPTRLANPNAFNGVCPTGAPPRTYDITAVLANNALTNALGVTIPANVNPATNVGGPLNPAGGTLVYNHRAAQVTGVGADPLTGLPVTITTPARSTTRRRSSTCRRRTWMRRAGCCRARRWSRWCCGPRRVSASP